MKLVLLAALATSAAHALAQEDTPADLSSVTRLQVVLTPCEGGPVSRWNVNKLSEVRALLNEVEEVRSEYQGISNSLVTCSTQLRFFAGRRFVSSLHVYACSALEPVDATDHAAAPRVNEYFDFGSGMSRLPRLARLVGVRAQDGCLADR